ncbi:P-loop containing nucleoside triphosphate hydrolase protein [Dentipellis sp. KUC8613]|nr:P-loop containing nucleoside triphosphate hydrolase protein [Dentipellis sp. KUC8613]
MPTVQICPNILSRGFCSNNTCEFQHDLFACDTCDTIFPSRSAYNDHLQSRRHRNRVSGASTYVECSICHVGLSQSNWAGHIRAKGHLNKAKAQGVDPRTDPVEPSNGAISGTQVCNVCHCGVPQRFWAAHFNGPTHRRAEQFLAYKAVYDDAAKDKHGVTISHIEGLDFGIVEVADVPRARKELTIETTIPRAQVKILSIKWSSASSSAKYQSSPFSMSGPASQSVLTFGRRASVTVALQQKTLGRWEDRLEVTLEDTLLGQRFTIVRSVRARIGSKSDYEALKPSAPYKPRPRGNRPQEKDVVEGIAPPALDAVRYVLSLPRAEIPKQIASIISTGSVDKIVDQLKRTVLPPALTSESYGRFFKILLWVEEHRMESDLQTYDIPNATLRAHGPYYYLVVPGLAEKRPSVLVGDRILVQRQGVDTGKWFEGHVHFVRQMEVGLRFHGSFPVPGLSQQHHVRFKLNRIPVRRQHQALDTAFISERILFPTEAHLPTSTLAARRIAPFDRNIATNINQMKAVVAMMSLPPGSPPFLLFGPPGTGKTVTTVETIKQILNLKDPNTHILVCAPSNSAADLIASKLTSLGTEQLFRFYAPSRPKDTVPDSLLPFTCSTPDGHFSHPPVPTLRRYKVMVTTCVSASFAFGVGIPRGHFSHIFVDEAGQATEPEVMIAVKTMADLKTNVILSGDPKQLGPIIRSAVARKLELDTSYMERLLERPMYLPAVCNGCVVVKLTKNYRSHPAILRYPNERFYDGDLEPCGDPKVINSYIGNPILVSKKFPIIFHGMTGQDAREASSPSFFNIEEVLQVKAYVEALRADRTCRITDADIGIIAPYHAQVQKIRKLLRPFADGVKVGSVEEFQGQERRVIIISTVRSSQEFVEYDLKHTLGFVANPRRFNVAVTRAKALLIVVGDPTVLSLDPLWRAFLNYVHRNKGWTGIPISWDPAEPVRVDGGYDAEIRARGVADMNDFAERMQGLTLQGVAGEVDEADANGDRPWRELE